MRDAATDAKRLSRSGSAGVGIGARTGAGTAGGSLAGRVSDVLRTYVSGQFDLRATSQTSPEFLASIADSPRFSKEDKGLLATFLDRCDMLKFARIEAHAEENNELLGAAAAFVQGARP